MSRPKKPSPEARTHFIRVTAGELALIKSLRLGHVVTPALPEPAAPAAPAAPPKKPVPAWVELANRQHAEKLSRPFPNYSEHYVEPAIDIFEGVAYTEPEPAPSKPDSIRTDETKITPRKLKLPNKPG